MTQQSMYISNTQSSPAKSHRKALASIFTTLMLAIILSLSAISGVNTAKADDKNFDPVQFVMCFFGKGTMAQKAYQFASTDDVPFKFRSKSSVTSGNNDVTTGWNWLLQFSGHDFKKINENVLGRRLDQFQGGDDSSSSDNSSSSSSSSSSGSSTPSASSTSSASPTSSSASSTSSPTSSSSSSGSSSSSSNGPAKKFNQGPVVNPYDRFGVAGLNFSAYLGEWKYVKVDACAKDADAKDPKTGLYYDNRIVPQTTWDNIPNTKDIRTAQLKRGVLSQEIMGTMTILSNFIFSITKGVVVITIALINFAFSDITHLLGIDKVIVGNGKQGQGLFGQIYTGLFQPLVVFMFIMTAINMAYMAFVQKKYRGAVTMLLRSIFMFIAAVVLAAKPTAILNIPNSVAVGGQALVVSTIGTSVSGGNGLCNTNVGDTPKTVKIGGKGTGEGDTKAKQSFIAKATQDIDSTISCSLWEQLLLKPWAQGQFGVDWNGTWAANKTPTWAKKDGTWGEFDLTKIKSSGPKPDATGIKNAMKIAGDAQVPIGGGKFINNWAVFQISTQTNVHSPIGHDGEMSKITAGVANDWWRIVDITSGYDETQKKMKDDDLKGDNNSTETNVSVADPNSVPIPIVWNNWIGLAGVQRLLVALSSVPIAILAVIGPLFFAGLAAIYAVGTSILLIFAPIMLLFACWGNRGWDLFVAWFNQLLQNVIRRILAGLLLVVNIMFVSACLKIIEDGSWVSGIITMCILSFVLIKSRHKVLDTLQSVRLNTSASMESTTKKVNDKMKSGAKRTGRMTSNVAIGGVTAKRNGGTFKEGATAGSKGELKSMAYRSPILRRAMQEYNTQQVSKKGEDASEFDNMKDCIGCNESLIGKSPIYQVTDGFYICENCFNRGDNPDATEIEVDWDKAMKDGEKKFLKQEAQGKDVKAEIFKSQMNNEKNVRPLNEVKEKKLTGDEAYKRIGQVAAEVNNDVNYHKSRRQEGNLKNTVEIPDEIRKYINKATLDQAWLDGEYDYIKEVYTLAWAQWAVENYALAYGDTIEKVIEQIRNEIIAEDLKRPVDERNNDDAESDIDDEENNNTNDDK